MFMSLLLFIFLEIDRKEARINAMRCAILETFPEPNRRLLQRSSLSLSLCPSSPQMIYGVALYFILFAYCYRNSNGNNN